MLRIDTFTATRLLSLNVRTENHGEGLARAIDLKCQMDAPNTFLQQLAPELLAMLFMPVEQPEAQAKLDGVPETLPLLRSHAIKWPLDLEGDYAGYQLTVDRGLGGTSNMVLQEAKLNDANLGNAVLTGARRHYATFQGTNMEGCKDCPVDWEK